MSGPRKYTPGNFQQGDSDRWKVHGLPPENFKIMPYKSLEKILLRMFKNDLMKPLLTSLYVSQIASFYTNLFSGYWLKEQKIVSQMNYMQLTKITQLHHTTSVISLCIKRPIKLTETYALQNKISQIISM